MEKPQKRVMKETLLSNEALKYIIKTLRLAGLREVQWAAEGVQKANPLMFRYKDSKEPKERLQFDLWELIVEYHIRHSELLYSLHTTTQSFRILETNYLQKRRRIEHELNYTEKLHPLIRKEL